MRKVVVGADIGGTNTPFSLIDRDGNSLIDTFNISTRDHKFAETFVDEMAIKIKEALKLVGDAELVGIGIGAPNGNYYNGTIEFAPNLQWKGVIPLVDLFKSHFDIPVVLTNDANAAAIGEMIFGGAKELRDFIVITLGTGLGSGIVANGELIYGFDGFAGELGHVIVSPGGRMCGCGRRGCLETYVSATGIKRTVYKLLADLLDDSQLRNVSFNELSAEMISIAASGGDTIALKAFEYTGEVLGKALADFAAFSTPKTIFLFGGLAKAGDFIFEPTKKHFEENLLKIYKNKIQILPSELQNKNAAILGAAALIWKQIDED